MDTKWGRRRFDGNDTTGPNSTAHFFGPLVQGLRAPDFAHLSPGLPFPAGGAQVIYRQLGRLDFRVPEELLGSSYDLYNGDFLAGGRGELLVRAN